VDTSPTPSYTAKYTQTNLANAPVDTLIDLEENESLKQREMLAKSLSDTSKRDTLPKGQSVIATIQ